MCSAGIVVRVMQLRGADPKVLEHQVLQYVLFYGSFTEVEDRLWNTLLYELVATLESREQTLSDTMGVLIHLPLLLVRAVTVRLYFQWKTSQTTTETMQMAPLLYSTNG